MTGDESLPLTSGGGYSLPELKLLFSSFIPTAGLQLLMPFHRLVSFTGAVCQMLLEKNRYRNLRFTEF